MEIPPLSLATEEGRVLSKLTTREAGKALLRAYFNTPCLLESNLRTHLKLLVAVLAVDMNLGLKDELDHCWHTIFPPQSSLSRSHLC